MIQSHLSTTLFLTCSVFKNYTKIAFRNLWKYKIFTSINVIGLGVGMAISFIILQFVVSELSYDRFHKNGSRIFKVANYNPAEPGINTFPVFKKEIAPYLVETNPSVKQFVRIKSLNGVLITNPDNPERSNIEQNFGFVDPSFFSVFSFKVLQSHPTTLLSRPFCVIISKNISEKYFGSKDPVGRKIRFKTTRDDITSGNGQLLEVVGVMENPPVNSTIRFDFISSTATYESLNRDSPDFNYETFLVLDDPKSAENVAGKLSAACKFIKSFNYRENDIYRLEPLLSLHSEGMFSTSTKIKVFSGTAITILLLALFNYINLTTARATIRAKEVGIRKMLGVSRLSLMYLFFAESLLITISAFFLALILLGALRTSLNDLFVFQIEISSLTVKYFFAAVMLILISTAVIAGSYPALVLSNFNPVKVLKGNTSSGSQGMFLRRTLIVLQFTVSAILISGSFFVQKQISFLQHSNPGYNTDQLLNITLSRKLETKSRILKQDLKINHGFENVSSSNFSFLTGYNGMPFYNPATRKQQFMGSIRVDEDFVENIGIKLVAPLNTNLPGDENGYRYVLNETAVKELGLTNENVIGHQLYQHENEPSVRVAGVVKDFDIFGPKYKTGPFMLEIHDGKGAGYRLGCIQVRLSPKDDIQQKLALLEKVYKKYEPEWPFQYSFVDDDFERSFMDDLRISKIVQVFTIVAVFLACMGLFGLITFTTQTRTKEIGIRKVLGASILGLASLLSADFIRLVILSIALAMPLSYYFVDKWLQNFPVRVAVSWLPYALTALISIIIAIATISFQSIKAALKNPVDSLKID
jgi:putative ABC transport system permease protein